MLRYNFSPLIWVLNRSVCLVSALALGPAAIRLFSSSSPALPHIEPGSPLPEGQRFTYGPLPSIHSSDFFVKVYEVCLLLLSSNTPGSIFSIMIECLLTNGQYRTLYKSFHISEGITIKMLEELLTHPIEVFEEQSGTGEEGPSVISTRVLCSNITEAPNPEATPFSSSSANLQWKADIKADKKASRRPSLAIKEIQLLGTQFTQLKESQVTAFAQLKNTMESQTQAIVSAIKETKVPVTQQSSYLGLNWQPIIQGLVSGVASSMGAQLSFPTVQNSVKPQAEVSVASAQGIDLSPLLAEIKELKDSQQQLTAQMAQQASTIQQLANSTSRIDKIESSIIQLTQALTQLAKISGNSGGSSDSDGGTSSAPQTPVIPVNSNSAIESSKEIKRTILDFDPTDSSKNSPLIEQTPIIEKETKIPARIPEITTIKPFDQKVKFKEEIVCADLEALISPEGLNQVYQAAWYNGKFSRVFDISEFEYSVDRMLKAFWLNLIEMNKGKVCFFHNWGGYDSILSLPQLLASSSSYSFEIEEN